ncbi:MAG: uridine phosphorylase [Thermofilum sp. ex4484_15]|nr:MAG: uridine phosphorylase [Thermofilum sp. ex4484_15]
MVSAERPSDRSGRRYHIAVAPGQVAPYVLLPGDPSRARRIAKYWDESELIAEHREYVTYTGRYKGVPVSVTSTGIGGPAAAIAVEELASVGAHTFIRVGSTGAIVKEVGLGELIIPLGAVRLDGTSKQYVREEYPAVPHYEVLVALIEAAEGLGYKYHLGIVASTDSFYTGQGRPGYGGYRQSWMLNLVDDLRNAKVLSFEMECSTIFTLSNLFGLRSGAVLAVFANRVTNEFEVKGEEEAIKVANEAVKILSEWDSMKERENKKYWHPSLSRG